jgi:hypothetical protein
LNKAYELGFVLQSYKFCDDDPYAWLSDERTIATSDYMVGYAGVGACMLRLSDLSLPSSLYRESFRKVN